MYLATTTLAALILPLSLSGFAIAQQTDPTLRQNLEDIARIRDAAGQVQVGNGQPAATRVSPNAGVPDAPLAGCNSPDFPMKRNGVWVCQRAKAGSLNERNDGSDSTR